MTVQELKNQITAELAAPVNSIQKIINILFLIIDFFTESSTDNLPLWTAAQTFQTDGSDDGKYCKYEDTDGNVRIFETKTDDNINHEPPTDPEVTENDYWQELSPAVGSSIKEWQAGIYGEGLIIVFHNHSTDEEGLYKLEEASRPFNSTDIETETAAGKWKKISNKQLFRGYYISFAALSAAVPVGDTGNYAIVDAGGGSDAQLYVWDEDEEWVLATGSTIVFASQAEAETAADATEANRNNLASFTARSWRWAFESVKSLPLTITNRFSARQISSTVQSVAPSGAVQTINFDSGAIINFDTSAATGNITLTLQNPVAGSWYTILASHGATARNLIFPAGTIQQGELGTTYYASGNNKKDVLYLYYDGANYWLTVAPLWG